MRVILSWIILLKGATPVPAPIQMTGVVKSSGIRKVPDFMYHRTLVSTETGNCERYEEQTPFFSLLCPMVRYLNTPIVK